MSSYPGAISGWIVFNLDEPHPEPLAFIAGDSLTWNRGFEQYPASAGWTLTYVLNNPTQKYVVNSADVVPDGDGFTVTIPAAETKLWTPGNYLWLAVMQNGSQRDTCAAGRVLIQPDILDATTPVDTRAQEEIALENIKAVLAGRASDGTLEYKIGDRELRRYSMAELITLKSHFVAEVRSLRVKRGEYVEPDTVSFHADWGING
jgi:hypothetical protein